MKQLFGYTPATPTKGLVGYVQLHESGHGGYRIVVRNHRGDGQHAECPLPQDQAVALAPAIKLNPCELQSGLTRVRWAELLIAQLPTNHEGRNSWLINYGTTRRTNV